MSRILAVDYGRRRIGVAVSDPLGIIAKPLEVVVAGEGSVAQIANAVRTHGVSEVVLGMPPDDRGDGLREEIARFGRALEDRTGVPVRMVDETMTTREALERVHAKGGKLHQVKYKLDALAASVLLQDVLDRRRTR